MPCLEPWLLIWHFMSNGILLKFDGSHHAVVVLLVSKSHPGVTKSQWRHFWSCNGKVPTMFFQSLLVMWNIWAHIFRAQAAAQESKRWDSYHGLKGSWSQEVQSKRVNLRSCREPPVVSFPRRLSFLLEEGRCLVLSLDYWFDISWPMAYFSSSMAATMQR